MRSLFRHIVLWVAGVLLTINVNATGGNGYDLKTNLNIANDLFARHSYYNAAMYYEYVLEEKPTHLEATFYCAESNRLIRNYTTAELMYKRVVDADIEAYPTALFYYGLMLKVNSKCTDAEAIFDRIINEPPKKLPAEYQNRAQIEKSGCALQISSISDPDVTIKHTGGYINGLYPNFGAFPVSKDKIIFSSIYSDTAIVIHDTINYTSPEALCRLYTSTYDGKNWGEPSELPATINGSSHTANGTFSPDGSLFFFTRCITNEQLENICDIYVSRYVDGVWEQPIKLSAQVNAPGFNNTQPTVLTDETGQTYLVFSSNRDGGSGGYDLYSSKFEQSLVFAPATNMGTSVNTNGDEVTPFYQNASGTLYFSSNGLVNMGGFDVFKTKRINGSWQKPENLGKPVNTSVDDLYFTLMDDQRTGFLSSNRPGTYSLLAETTSEDIYSVSMVKTVEYFGFSYELGDSNLMPLTSVTYTLYTKNEDLGLYEMVSDFKPEVVDGQFNIPLKAGHDYKITASKNNYLSQSLYFSTADINKANDREKVYFRLDKISKDKTYTLNNIYYDYNSATLRDSSRFVLDTLYQLLVENPNIVIELSSHTDSRGSKDYNLDLSQNRAQSCVDYLIAKGIQQERLVAKGYGEEKLLNRCADGVNCTEAEHQINRRTEFRVIGQLEDGVKVKGQ